MPCVCFKCNGPLTGMNFSKEDTVMPYSANTTAGMSMGICNKCAEKEKCP